MGQGAHRLLAHDLLLIVLEEITYLTDTGPQPAVAATPDRPQGSLLCLHENKGLTPYMRHVVEALAEEGWMVLAPDLLVRRTADADRETATTQRVREAGYLGR